MAAALFARLQLLRISRAWRSWSRCRSRDAAGRGIAGRALRLCRRSAASRAGIGRSTVYSYRVWGRLLYNPEADPDSWQRDFEQQFRAGAQAAEAALASASRILPIVTTAHLPSAANNTYLARDLHQPADRGRAQDKNPIPIRRRPRSSATPARSTRSCFRAINDFADELLKGERSGKYSPIEVAQWLEDLAETAARQLAQAENQAVDKGRAGVPAAGHRCRPSRSGSAASSPPSSAAACCTAIHERTGDRARWKRR